MSGQQSIVGLDAPERDAAAERSSEYYPTPRLLVRAVLARLVHPAWDANFGADVAVWLDGCPELFHASALSRPVRIVDVGCGPGVWASEARRLFTALGIPVVITGIDTRADVGVHARRWCDEFIVGDFRDVLGGIAGDGAPVSRRWDLLVSNPAFSTLRLLIPLALECATVSIILHTEQSLTRTDAMAALVERTPPRHELRIAQGVSFTGRGPDRIRKPDGSEVSGSDSRGYSVTTWQGGTTPGQAWTSSVLRLPTEARGWRVRPGEEPASDDLPEVVRDDA